MTLREAVVALDNYPLIAGTYWGDAIIACRECARAYVHELDKMKQSEVCPYCHGTGVIQDV